MKDIKKRINKTKTTQEPVDIPAGAQVFPDNMILIEDKPKITVGRGGIRYEIKRSIKKQIDEIYIAIEQVLMYFGTPDYYYSIGEPVDDCACLEYFDNKWIVYEMSRGNKINDKSFDSAFEAGCELFDLVAINNETLAMMKERLEFILSFVSRVDDYKKSCLESNITFYHDNSSIYPIVHPMKHSKINGKSGIYDVAFGPEICRVNVSKGEQLREMFDRVVDLEHVELVTENMGKEKHDEDDDM